MEKRKIGSNAKTYNNCKARYSDGKTTFADGLVVTDHEVAAFVKKHSHWWDRLDYHKMCDAASEAFCMLCGATEIPKGKWYF